MQYQIEKKVPYLIMGGAPITNETKSVSEKEFWDEMEDIIGRAKFHINEQRIREHLQLAGNHIEFGDFIFYVK